MSIVDIISSIPFVSKVFFLCFLVFGIIEVVFAFFEKELLRKIFKPFCLMFLAVAVTIALPHHRLLYFAAYLAMTGDIFLLRKRSKIFFPLGTLSFMIGHILFYVEVVKNFLPAIGYSLPTWSYFVYWIALTVFALIILKPVRKNMKMKFIPALGGSFYYGILGFSAVIYIIATVFGFKAGITNYMWLAVIGICFFIFSDLFLGYTTFIKDVKRRDFYIMLSYLIAESLILLAFVFTYYGNPSIFSF